MEFDQVITGRRAVREYTAQAVRHVYTGNVHDEAGHSTYCHDCGTRIIGRDWYRITSWQLDEAGCCQSCGTHCAGVFEGRHGTWGARRLPIELSGADQGSAST